MHRATPLRPPPSLVPADPAVAPTPASRGPAARLWAWARVLAGAGILGLLLWRLGTGAFLAGLQVIDSQTLLLAFGIGALTTVCSAWRWCLVADGLGMRLPLRGAIADYYRALFLNAALPGGVLGDVHRAVRHGREVGDVGRGVKAVVLERFAGQVVLITVGVTVLLVYPSPVRSHAHLSPIVLAVAAAVAVVGIGIALVARDRLRHGASRVGRALRTGLRDVRSGLLARHNWPGIVLSSALVLAGHLATFLIAARAAGSSVPIARLLPLMVLALLAMTLPLNIGGWGPREGVAAWAFGAAGLSATQGLTIAVVYGLFAFVASLPGAGVLIARWVIRLRTAGEPIPLSPQPQPVSAETPARDRIRRRKDHHVRPAAHGVAGLVLHTPERGLGFLINQAGPNRPDSA